VFEQCCLSRLRTGAGFMGALGACGVEYNPEWSASLLGLRLSCQRVAPVFKRRGLSESGVIRSDALVPLAGY